MLLGTLPLWSTKNQFALDAGRSLSIRTSACLLAITHLRMGTEHMSTKLETLAQHAQVDVAQFTLDSAMRTNQLTRSNFINGEETLFIDIFI